MLTFTTDLLAHTTLTYSLSTCRYAWSHCSDVLTLTSLTIWLRWEQPVNGGSGFAGSSGSGFAGSKLLAVDLASLGAS